ncbi:unnamed protein product [Rhizophagus irregularis]|nr:unnamed protein product [Rhizophagus irregularis]
MERCWNTEPCLRPNIHEVYNVLLNLWSSIYHNNHLTSLNSTCIEFLVADNNEDYSKSNSQEIITQKPENNNLEPLEMIKYIRESSLVKVFNIDELTMMTPINNDKFCKISKATLKTKETNMIVVCRRIKCNQLDRPFFHELNKRKRLYLCLRILRVLGISLDENTEEFLLVMQFADSGNLRWYLKDHFSKLTWNDKLKFSYQITEGIKYLHDEDICHQSLHSRNIVIHSNEAKIILYIMKSTETDYLSVSDEMIPYVDPKLLENQSYEYDKKSDIYSLGVLMWELTSGYPPFIYNEAENHLVIDLINGHREKSIPKTPNAYLDLYESCWDPEPNERPSINQVFSKLGKMYTQTNTNLKMSEIINLIKNNFLVKRIINIGELSDINGNTTWKKQAVIYKKYKFDQLNEAFIHELKMHRKLNFYSRFVQILGISLDESAEECLLIMQHAEDGNLRQYLKSHFLELSWDDKIKLSYQITEGIKYLHNEDILHQNLNPNNIVIHKNDAKIVLDFVKSTESGYSSDYGMISYIDPKLLENYSYEYDKKSDIYSLGVLMWEITSGYPPKTENISKSHNIDGCRETPIPVEYLDLCESCWNNEPDKRPSISLVFNKLVEMNKNSASQFINLIKKHTRIINRNELSDMEKIDGGHFGIISKATWKDTKVICKKLVNNESICNKPIEALRHELEMHRRLDFCQRIIRILGISLDESTKEYSLIIQYADSGNLRKYLENNFSTLTWNDKIKLAYQITEGIKFLQVCGHREKPESDTPDEYLNLYILCWDSEPDARPSINQVFNKLVKLGRMRGIQDFQDIKCDDDDMQDIQNDNDNDLDTQVNTEESIYDAAEDDNYDLDID